MKNTCGAPPYNKKLYVTEIGQILVKEYGKKKYYQPEEVKKAHLKSSWFESVEFACWAMCIFSNHVDFDKYHQDKGEVCDYAQMKAEMLSGLAVSPPVEMVAIPDGDIDASWLDFGELFGFLIEGIGEFIVSSILDNLSD